MKFITWEMTKPVRDNIKILRGEPHKHTVLNKKHTQTHTHIYPHIYIYIYIYIYFIYIWFEGLEETEV